MKDEIEGVHGQDIGITNHNEMLISTSHVGQDVWVTTINGDNQDHKGHTLGYKKDIGE